MSSGLVGRSPTRLEGMEIAPAIEKSDLYIQSPTRLEGMEISRFYRRLQDGCGSPTRLEGMEMRGWLSTRTTDPVSDPP